MRKRWLPLLGIILAASLHACGRSLPPSGTARLTLVHASPDPLGPKPHSGTSQLKLLFDYDGSMPVLELEAQAWTNGQLLPGSRSNREVINGPRNSLTLSFRQGNPNANYPYHLKSELRFDKGGGNTTTSSDLPLQLPGAASGWLATVAAAPTIDFPEGRSVPVWAYLTHREKIDLPAGAPLEEWAAKADAALVIRAKLTR